MERCTKIVCTLGPATSDPETIRALVGAGMDVARLNFSHGTHEDHARSAEQVRAAAEAAGRPVSILQDLQGPKIRVGDIKNGGILIHKGQPLTLTGEPLEESTEKRVYIDYPSLARDVELGGRILLDDGLLELEVVATNGEEVQTEVVVGGPLRSHKGVNLPHVRTSTPSLTKKDIADLEFGLSLGVDLIALSFVRSRTDVDRLLERIAAAGKSTSVIAKIEKPEALHNLDAILKAAGGLMVARGDLGIEMPMAEVPGAQKTMIRKGMARAKPVITATQMLESMIENPRPTRAEASDVANAVLDGSDAVMLSGETAVGKHPVRVVEVMAEIIESAEAHRHQYRNKLDQPPGVLERSDDITVSVSFTACRLAEQVGAAAIACLTSSGATARSISRHRPSMPIYAFTDQVRVIGQLGVLWGTKAFAIPFQKDTDKGVALVHQILSERGLVQSGDRIVLTAGMPLPAKGRTNMVHVSQV